MAAGCNQRYRSAYLLGCWLILAVSTPATLQAQPEPPTDLSLPRQPDNVAAYVEKKLRFNFAGTDWRTVLEWFAGEARMNLDWREMPDGQLNLITQHSYSIFEAHNVINMHLLSRGFTLLRRDGVLFLVKLGETLNPTMVPRVEPVELDDRPLYEYVKVSFPLEWMLAETAVKELAPTLSPYGKIIPLSATNRIEVMDAVANLRQLRDLLMQEQSGNSQEQLVAEFTLQHASAVEVIEKLHVLLGLEKSLDRMSRDQMRTAREQYVFRAELAKRLGDKAPPMKENRPEVFLVANERKNSILANAPPDKIAIIRQAILSLDVPSDEQGARLSEITTMKVYPLNGAEADAVSDILGQLREIGKIHPSARFSEDDDRQILFAYASLKDHLTINSVMDQLADSARTFKVIPLRRLQAGYVAQSIQTLMGGAEETSDGDRGDRWRRRRGQSAGNNWRGFRVEADAPNNRLFLFATEAEFKQVEELLVKIGERSSSSNKVRVVDVSVESVDRAIEDLRKLWPTMSDNPLQIDLPGHRENTEDSSLQREQVKPRSNLDRGNSADESRHDLDSRQWNDVLRDATGLASAKIPQNLAFVALEIDADESAENTGENSSRAEAVPSRRYREPAEAPLVSIRQGTGGELILSSEDSAALDQLERLLTDLVPERKPYTVFQLRYASPYTVELTLQEIFASEGLTATMPLKLVSDATTKSIIVFGASSSQLREIQQLIDFYDQPQPADAESARKPRFFTLQYASAEVVAGVVKEIYRHVLSPNDKAVAQPRDNDSSRPPIYVPVNGAVGNQPQFKGMLSIGTFPATNTLIVSAPEYLSREIAETIKLLDRPEASTVTSVVTVNGGVSASFVASQLANLMAPAKPATAPPQNGNQQRVSRDNERPAERVQEPVTARNGR